MSLFGDIGNFFGGIFNQKKKEDEQRPTVQAPQLTVQQPQQQQNVGIQMPQSFMIPTPTSPSIAPPILGSVRMDKPQAPNPVDFSGMSNEDRGTAQSLIDRGKDADGFIKLAKDGAKLKAKSDYENSFVGKVANTGGSVGRMLGGGAIDVANFVSRIPQTIDTAKDSAVVGITDALGLDNSSALRAAQKTQDDYNRTQELLSALTNNVAGENMSTNADTTREAQAISTGQASAGDIFSAITKALGAATVLPAGRVAASLKAGSPSAVRNAESSLLRSEAKSANQLEQNKVLDNEFDSLVDSNKTGQQRFNEEFKSNDGPITKSPTTNKTPAITSANPDFVPPAKPQAPQPFQTAPGTGAQPPAIGGIQPLRTATQDVGGVSAPVRTADDQMAEIKQALDEAQTAPAPQQAPIASQVAETPQMAEARAIANDTPPVNQQAIQQAVEAQRVADAPTEAIAQYNKPVRTGGAGIPGDTRTLYNTGDSNLDGIVNDSIIAHKGTAGTASVRADALDAIGVDKAQRARIRSVATRQGNFDKTTGRLTDRAAQEIKDIISEKTSKPLPTTPKATIAPTKLDLGDTGKQVDDLFGKAPTPVAEIPSGELGRITQKAVQSGRKLDDAEWEQLAREVGEISNVRAGELGTDVPTILGKVQKAWESSGKIKSAEQAGLTKDEFKLYDNMTNEMDYLRSRADPSLVTGGKIGKWYAPRQAKGTEYDPTLVNEMGRGGDLTSRGDLDLSTTPIEQYIRRYGNAENVVKESVFSTVENAPIKRLGQADRIESSGIKLSDSTKENFSKKTSEYIAKKDEIEVALTKPEVSVKDIDSLAREMDDSIDQAFRELMNDIPADTAAGREAIARLTTQRGSYMQGTIRSNMFSNIVNRAMDQTQAALVKGTNQAMGISDRLTGAAFGTHRALATGGAAKAVAKQYSRGSLGKQIARDFRTNMALRKEGNLASTVDTGYRAASTSLTSAGDLTTTTVKTTNMAWLARAQSEGITSRAGLEKYLREGINSAEYKELLQGVQDAYAGYVSMPMSAGSRLGRAGTRFSKLDNAIVNSQKLKDWGVPPRVRRELNDAFMPALTGFAGATYRVGAKSLNAAALGVPGMIKGLRIAKEGGETARQIGQIMIARSLVDGVVGGVASAATVGALVANAAEWTGEYPSDSSERARWEKDGIKENALSFDMGDGKKLQVQPGRLMGVFALPIVLPAVIKSGGSVFEVVDATMGQMLDNLGANSILETAKDISTAIVGDGYQKESATKKLLSSAGFSLSAVVPLSGLVNNVANATDDKKRDTSGGVIDTMKNRLPGVRQTLPEKLDNLGNPISNNVQDSLGSSVISTATGGDSSKSEDGGNALDTEINRLSKLGSEVVPGQDVKNTGGTDDAKLLLSSKLYEGADDEKKAEYLKDALLGTKTKDVNKSLDSKQRGALIEHTLMDTDARKAWLEDNDNAANFYQADYDNAKANKTLTTNDDNLQIKTGKKYLATKALVNQETGADESLEALYEQITQKDLKNMLDPENEDGEYDQATAEKLIAYDNARTAKGVSDHKFTNKSKYDVDLALKSLAKGKGGGKKSFAFASLPSSLTGTGSGGSGKGSGYADSAPLFKPIADLKAPKGAPIPTGRTISVKKGITV